MPMMMIKTVMDDCSCECQVGVLVDCLDQNLIGQGGKLVSVIYFVLDDDVDEKGKKCSQKSR